jgi:hypothetical protein
MANKTNDLIGATVIQRSFIPSGLAKVLHIVTAPLSEIVFNSDKIDDDTLLRSLTAEILGIPSSILIDERQYMELRRIVLDGQRGGPYRNLGPFWEEIQYFWFRQMRSGREETATHSDAPLIRFAEDVIALLASPSSQWNVTPPWFQFDEQWLREFSIEMKETDVDSEAVSAGLACLSASVLRPSKVRYFTTDLMRYEIPLGQSPSTQSDSLLKLLETGRKMCLAPLVAGGTLGVGNLGQGQYVAALLSVGTGSAMTLILLGTVAVGSLLVNRVAQKRSRAPKKA